MRLRWVPMTFSITLMMWALNSLDMDAVEDRVTDPDHARTGCPCMTHLRRRRTEPRQGQKRHADGQGHASDVHGD